MQALPEAWVDRLFGRLTMVYGHAFLSRWSGMDLAAVKASWAHELAGFAAHPQALAAALEALPADHPPTVLQFRDLARAAARQQGDVVAQLPSPEANPAMVAEVMAAVKEASKQPRRNEAQICADRLRAIRDHGDRPMTLAQRAMLASVERVLGEGAAA